MPQAVRGRFTIPWRRVSGLLALSTSALLALFFTSTAFDVHTIAGRGVGETMLSDEIFNARGTQWD